MKLYVTFSSPYARIARIVVAEKGLADRVEIIEAKTRTAGSPYYRINPSGRVPYLIDDAGLAMEDSCRARQTWPSWSSSQGSTSPVRAGWGTSPSVGPSSPPGSLASPRCPPCGQRRRRDAARVDWKPTSSVALMGGKDGIETLG
jgi:hypothetical protein